MSPGERLLAARGAFADKRVDEAAALLHESPAAPEHQVWLLKGEIHLARGHFRRALGAFRRSQTTDHRGDNAFVLHNSIGAISTILLQQRRFFLHVHDEAKVFVRGRREVNAAVLALLAEEARSLKGTAKSSVHHALEAIEMCARGGELLPQYADQSPALELESAGSEALRAIMERWLDAAHNGLL